MEMTRIDGCEKSRRDDKMEEVTGPEIEVKYRRKAER
jgi:hypothetical protein